MATHTARVVVVDDHVEMARILADQLGDAGYTVDVADSADKALALARTRLPDLVVTDLRMEHTDGLDLLEGLRTLDPEMPVIIMTAFGGVETAVEAIRRGAFHYITKPFPLQEMLIWVERAIKERRLRDENHALRRLIGPPETLDGIIGSSPGMQAVSDLVRRVASSNAPVLVRGESGTGKELVASAVHTMSARRDRPFVAVNCTTLPESILESELFGHVRGAFTGAGEARRGLFIEAEGGTLFLDEIGDMPLALQAKLLRVLDGGEVRPVGADASRRVDVRIVAATNQPLEERVKTGAFRPDLFFRLSVVPILLPPLRDRREDIPALVEYFLARARRHNPSARTTRLSDDLIAGLSELSWPGNVRELKNLVERVVIVCPKEVADVSDLAGYGSLDLGVGVPSPLDRARDHLVTLRQLEEDYIGWVIDRCGGNKTKAAEILGIDVSTIHRRVKGPKG